MKIAIINELPPGNFEEITIYVPGWHMYFLKLIQENRHIKYEVLSMPTLTAQLEAALAQQGYRHLILKDEEWWHFLVPPGAPESPRQGE